MKKETLKRWGCLIAYSLLGVLGGLPLGIALHNITENVLGPLCEFSPALGRVTFVSIHVALIVVILMSGGFRISHFRHVTTWPPLLTAVPIGLWVLSGCLLVSDPSPTNNIFSFYAEEGFLFQICALVTSWVLWVVIAAKSFPDGLQFKELIRGLIARDSQHPRSDRSQIPSQVNISGLTAITANELISWSSSEGPIEDRKGDFFQALPRSKRILEALGRKRVHQTDQELFQTIVLQGAFGSGKSSIIKLVEQLATSESPDRYVFVQVNCWGFSSIAAQQHVLDQAVHALSLHVDCLSLRRLPSAYSEAIQESNTWIGAITNFLESPEAPEKVLERFSPILKAIDRHLVIVIEDTDRNSADFDQSQIEAMLHRLRKVERVSFVLTAGEQSKIDFAKVADAFETSPIIDSSACVSILVTLLNEAFSQDFYDPYQMSLFEGEQPTKKLLQLEDPNNPSHGLLATSRLITTPRKLKRVWNAVYTRWSALRGEVDLHDLLVWQVLKHCAEPVFNFILSHHQYFSITQGLRAELNKRQLVLKERCDKSISESNANPMELRVLIERLVPDDFLPEQNSAETNQNAYERYSEGLHWALHSKWPQLSRQSVLSDRGSVYWDRLIGESVYSDQITDQEVLQTIHEWHVSKNPDSMSNHFIESQEFADIAMFFKPTILANGESYTYDFCTVVLNQARPFREGQDHDVNSTFKRVRELIDDLPRNPDNNRFRTWVAVQLENAFAHDLDDALCVYELVTKDGSVNPNWDIADLFIKKMAAQLFLLGSEFEFLCRPHFEANLSKVLEIAVIARLTDKKRANFITQLSKKIVSALQRNPTLMSEYVMWCFADTSDRQNLKFQTERLVNFFKRKTNVVLTILSSDEVLAGEKEPKILQRRTKMQRAARDLLALKAKDLVTYKK